jgi:hypothetical protein
MNNIRSELIHHNMPVNMRKFYIIGQHGINTLNDATYKKKLYSKYMQLYKKQQLQQTARKQSTRLRDAKRLQQQAARQRAARQQQQAAKRLQQQAAKRLQQQDAKQQDAKRLQQQAARQQAARQLLQQQQAAKRLQQQAARQHAARQLQQQTARLQAARQQSAKRKQTIEERKQKMRNNITRVKNTKIENMPNEDFIYKIFSLLHDTYEESVNFIYEALNNNYNLKDETKRNLIYELLDKHYNKYFRSPLILRIINYIKYIISDGKYKIHQDRQQSNEEKQHKQRLRNNITRESNTKLRNEPNEEFINKIFSLLPDTYSDSVDFIYEALFSNYNLIDKNKRILIYELLDKYYEQYGNRDQNIFQLIKEVKAKIISNSYKIHQDWQQIQLSHNEKIYANTLLSRDINKKLLNEIYIKSKTNNNNATQNKIIKYFKYILRHNKNAKKKNIVRLIHPDKHKHNNNNTKRRILVEVTKKILDKN